MLRSGFSTWKVNVLQTEAPYVKKSNRPQGACKRPDNIWVIKTFMFLTLFTIAISFRDGFSITLFYFHHSGLPPGFDRHQMAEICDVVI